MALRTSDTGSNLGQPHRKTVTTHDKINTGPQNQGDPHQDHIAADEFIDQAFCDALKLALQDETKDAYWLCYTNHFLGKPLRFGLAQRKLALFRTGKALYEKIDEDGWSTLDRRRTGCGRHMCHCGVRMLRRWLAPPLMERRVDGSNDELIDVATPLLYH